MAASTSPEQGFGLPSDFLTGPAPSPKANPILFEDTPLPEYRGLYAIVLDGILSPEECRALVAAAEVQNGGKWERALVNVGGGRQKMIEGVRKCSRIIWDEQEIVNRIWARCEPLVPELKTLRHWRKVTGSSRMKTDWQLTRLNERMRLLKYTSGEYFRRESAVTVLRF
jgi:hypothetical protein